MINSLISFNLFIIYLSKNLNTNNFFGHMLDRTVDIFVEENDINKLDIR